MRIPCLARARVRGRPTPIPTPTPMTATNERKATRQELARLLDERFVLRSSQLIEEFRDEELNGVASVIAYWDAIPAAKRTKGLLVHLMRERFQPPQQTALDESPEEIKARVRRERHEKDCRWAERNGFTRAQAPFAASARRVIAMLGSEPSAASVRARVKAQHPHLFDEFSSSREASVL